MHSGALVTPEYKWYGNEQTVLNTMWDTVDNIYPVMVSEFKSLEVCLQIAATLIACVFQVLLRSGRVLYTSFLKHGLYCPVPIALLFRELFSL